ncbi:MAG: hypothetical protein HY904_10280 [Deltaproteobacteria bacterium]|nr:hypothetical protein [Deltaproteobacteria bacterium]
MKLIKMLMLPLVAGALAMGCTGGDDDDDNGGGGGCDSNYTAATAKAFTVGTEASGKACDSTVMTGSYAYYKATLAAAAVDTDKYTVKVKLDAATDAGDYLQFGLGSDGTWGQSSYASDPTSISDATEHTKIDITPMSTGYTGTALYFIVSSGLTTGKTASFKFTVTKQP